MKVKIKNILLLFKKMYCDELKLMEPDSDIEIDITQNQRVTCIVSYQRQKKDLACNAEIMVDPINMIVYIRFTPCIQNIEIDFLLLPGIQCMDELEILHKNISILFSHPELNQEYQLTFEQLELLYKLFIK